MIAYLQSTLKLPAIGWIVDTGTYLGIGSSVLNKNLTIAGLNRVFSPYTGTGTIAGNSYSTVPTIYDSTIAGNNLMLTGNNCLLQMRYFPYLNNNGAYLQPIAKPGGWQAFCYGTSTPYFTSTMGLTNGNTYTIIGNEFSQVVSDGTLIKLNSAIGLTTVSGALANYHLNIIAENGQYFIGLENVNGSYSATTASQANFRFFSINKTTWAFASLGVLTNSKQYWYNAPKFMGITNDNKVLIACYPVPSAGAAGGVYGTLYYYYYDLNTNAVSQSTTGSLIHNLNTVTTCSVPSSWSTEILDISKNKFYIANCSSTSAITTISRIIVPKTLQNRITGTTITDPSMGAYAATGYNTITNIITANNDFVANQAIQFSAAFGNITTTTTYYVSATNLTSTGFSVSTTNGGSVLTLTGTSTIPSSVISTSTRSVANFSGTSYIYMNTNTGLAFGTNNFTIEMWLNVGSIGVGTNVMDFRPLSTNGAYPDIYLETTGAVSYMVNSAVQITSTGVSLVANTWNHVAVVRNSGSTKMYLNGTQVGVVYTDANTYLVGASRPVIGINGINVSSDGIVKNIYNLRIVNGTAVYTANFTPSLDVLTAITGTQLLIFQSATIVDNSSNANTITNTGPVVISQQTLSYATLPIGAISSTITCLPTICTTPGLTINIPNPNNAPATSTSTGTAACIYLNQTVGNGSEYIAVLTMGYANITGTGGYTNIVTCTNGCLPSAHSINVFKIDSTNSANLVYKSSINDGTAFGTNSVLFNYNASADNTKIVLSNETQFVVLTWNIGTESYTYSRVYTITDGIGRISLDTTNKLWIHSNTNSNVYLYTLNNVINAEITYSNGTTSGLSTLEYNTTTSTTNITPSSIVNSYISSNTKYYSTYFNGSSYFNLSAPANLAIGAANFTIEFWINESTITATQLIIDFRVAQGAYPCIYLNAGVLSYYVNTADQIVSTGVPLVTNTWNHVAVVRNSGSTKMYLNGTQVGVTYTDANTYLVGASRPTIGTSGATINTTNFTGSMYNLRIVTGAAGAVYTANFNPYVTSLNPYTVASVAGTQLLMFNTNNIIDNSTNANTITTTGVPVIQPYSPLLNQNRQVGNLVLNMSGPATFTSTGTTSATITTSATADTTIPLTISGPGNIAIVPTSFTPATTATPTTTTPPTTTVQPASDPYRPYVALHMKNTGTNTGTVTSVDNTQHIDSSSTPLTIQNNGNVMQSPYSPYLPNWSTMFDGASYLNLSAPAGLAIGTQNFTIELWCNISAIGTAQCFLDFRPSGTQGVYPCIYVETTGLVSYYVSTAVQITSTGVPLVANTWTHVAVVKNSGSTKMYLNGTQVGVTYTDANTYLVGASRPTIGTNGALINATNFTGFMSNLRIVTGTAVYTANFTPPTSALTAITGTQLLMCQANRHIDSSASANAITIAAGTPRIEYYNPFASMSSYSSSTYGGSGLFNGNTSYLNILDGSSTAFGTNNFTIEGWFYSVGLMSAINYLYDARPSGLTGYYPVIYINASNVILFNVNATDVITGPTVLSSAWTHVAVCRSNSSTKMFINGVQVGSTYSDTNSYTIGANRPVIGANGNAILTQVFNGYIANLRVLNGTALYTTTFTPPTSLLTNVANTALLFNFNNFSVATNTNNNTIIDSSPNKNAISVLGNGANTVVGQGSFNPYEPSYSTYFNGSSYVNLGAPAGLAIGTQSFTIEFWCNISAIGTQQFFLDFRPSGTQGVYPCIYVETTGLVSYYVNSVTQITSTGVPLVANTWTHIAVVKNSGSTKMYLNGTQVGVVYTDANTYLVGASRPTIGTSAFTFGTVNFTGFMSNLRIVTGTAVYTANFTPPTTALTAITGTQLLMCQANRFIDNSASANAITVTGTPYIESFIPFTATYNPANYSGSIFCNNSLLKVQHNNTLNLGSNNFTVECWVYPTNFATLQTIIYLNGNSTGGSGSMACNINTTGTLQTYVSLLSTSWSVNNTSTLTVTKNCWNHIAVVRNGTNITTYLNGVAAISQTLAGSLYTANQTTIGAYTPSATTYGQLFIGTYITDFNILVGTAKYTTTFTPSLTPVTSTANTALLLNGKNGGLYDSSMNTSLQTLTSTTNQVTVNTTTTKFNTGSTYFNGINSYLIGDYKPQLMLYGNFTIEMWINGTTNRGVFPTLISKNAIFATANNYFICYRHATAPNVISIHLSPSTPLCYGTITVSDNTWYHIAVVRNNNIVTLYVNGNPDCSFYSSGVWDYSTISIGNGAGEAPSQDAFGGYIDDLRITNGIARYTAQFIPSNQPMQIN